MKPCMTSITRQPHPCLHYLLRYLHALADAQSRLQF
jgi:hypothetical protein